MTTRTVATSALLLLVIVNPALGKTRTAKNGSTHAASDGQVVAGTGPSRTEQWVLSQLAGGRVADLEKMPGSGPSKDRNRPPCTRPSDKEPALSARFLMMLLGGKTAKPLRNGTLVRIKNAVVTGALDISRETIPYAIMFDDCDFLDRVAFDDSVFTQSVSFANSKFHGPVSFIGAHFSSVGMDGTHFCDEGQGATFNHIVVTDIASYGSAEFLGPADFVGARVGHQFQLLGTKFRSAKDDAAFAFVTVDEAMMIDHCVVTKGLQIYDSTIGSLSITNTNPENTVLGGIDLNRATVRRALRVENVRTSELQARAMNVLGEGSLVHLVTGKIDLSYSRFGVLDLSGLEILPGPGIRSRIDGLNYKFIRASEDVAESFEALLELVNESAYSGDAYSTLERFWVREGHQELADRVFVARKEREYREAKRVRTKLASWFWWVFVGYGRAPERAGYGLIALWLIGWFVFHSRSGMVPAAGNGQTDDLRSIKYSGGWYTLELLLPFLDFEMKKLWRPAAHRRGALVLMRCIMIAGWVLIPVFLLAVTGLVK